MALSTRVSSLSWNALTVAACNSFTISNNRETLDVTEIGVDRRTFIAGVQTATAAAEIYYDQADASTAAMEGAITSGASATLIVTLTSGQTYTASAFVTRFEITGQAGDLVRASVDFQITGPITIA